MPIGPPSQNVPKSGWSFVASPMLATHAAELGCSAAEEMSVFHALLAGNVGHPVAGTDVVAGGRLVVAWAAVEVVVGAAVVAVDDVAVVVVVVAGFRVVDVVVAGGLRVTSAFGAGELHATTDASAQPTTRTRVGRMRMRSPRRATAAT
jgi:hypothetical protein